MEMPIKSGTTRDFGPQPPSAEPKSGIPDVGLPPVVAWTDTTHRQRLCLWNDAHMEALERPGRFWFSLIYAITIKNTL